MIGAAAICAREECKTPFVKTAHNKKYCSSECCKIATNARLMERYHDNVAIKRGKVRNCKTCETKLSRYNPSKYCSSCELQKKDDKTSQVSDILSSVQWL